MRPDYRILADDEARCGCQAIVRRSMLFRFNIPEGIAFEGQVVQCHMKVAVCGKCAMMLRGIGLEPEERTGRLLTFVPGARRAGAERAKTFSE